MERPLLSIVVPTKDRYYYLTKLIELIESFNSTELELVIQDNSTNNDSFLSYINKYKHPFVKYHYVAGQLPMSVNSDYAIAHSSGEYVCFVGDDDGITSNIIQCVKWMKKNKIDAVLSSSVSYIWPDAVRRKEFDTNSKLRFNDFTGECHFLSAEDELLRLIKEGIINRGKLPRVYHGIASRVSLNKIYDKCGTFFPGSSPDISNAVALALVVDKFAIVDMPITISGASKFHGGGTDLINKKYPDLEDIPWLRPDAIITWEKTIPPKGIGISLWADSAIKALRAMGRLDLIQSVNYDAIYTAYLAAYPGLEKMVYPLCKDKVKVYCLSKCSLFRRYFNAAVRLVKAQLKKNFSSKDSPAFPTIVEAVKYLEERFVFEFPKN